MGSDRDGNELAVTRQREDLEKLCADKGWKPILHSDNDTSASTGKKRPGYQAMLADIEAGIIGAVAVGTSTGCTVSPSSLSTSSRLPTCTGLRWPP